jgi:hypothetical protein
MHRAGKAWQRLLPRASRPLLYARSVAAGRVMDGQKFGRWTVLERQPGVMSSGRIGWHCRCECGTTKVVDGAKLRRGQSQSCGCLRNELSRANASPNATPMEGLKFGSLEVLERAKSKGTKAYWKCRCVCGTVRDFCGSRLRRGDTKSCGCNSYPTTAVLRKRATTMWTEERTVILHRDWPTWRSRDDIAFECNQLPGDRISIQDVTWRATHDGLKRPPGYRPIRQSRRQDGGFQARKPGPNAFIFERRYDGPLPTQSDIDAWIAANGVKRLPTAACGATTATISEEDRLALAEYRAAKQIEWQQEHKQRGPARISSMQASSLAQRARV